jgi:hypothetical protein
LKLSAEAFSSDAAAQRGMDDSLARPPGRGTPKRAGAFWVTTYIWKNSG